MILVTGGAGFIGSNLVAALAASGQRPIVCDRLETTDKWRNLAKHEVHDLVEPEDLHALLERTSDRIGAVVHLGAISDTTARNVDALIATNFKLSVELWQWCAENRKQFVYASSAATYGDGEHGFYDDVSVDHLSHLRPLTPYAWSKHLFDRWIARRLADGGPLPMQWAGLKFFNVYGPNEYHKDKQASVAFHLYAAAAKGEPARLFRSYREDYEDGGQKRDFVWVGDCVEVMLWLLENHQVNGLFNVGSGTARRFSELAMVLFASLSKKPRIEYIDMPSAIRDNYQYFTEARIDKLREAGYTKPITNLEAGIDQYVKVYLEKPDPYR